MIPRKQIGWSQEENLLWEISKQLDKLLCINTACQTTSSTTTTTTTIPLVNTSDLFQECSEPCGTACEGFLIYYNVWMTQDCIDTFPTIGCEIWETEDRTVPFPDGTYNLGNGDCIVITGGIITNIIPK